MPPRPGRPRFVALPGGDGIVAAALGGTGAGWGGGQHAVDQRAGEAAQQVSSVIADVHGGRGRRAAGAGKPGHALAEPRQVRWARGGGWRHARVAAGAKGRLRRGITAGIGPLDAWVPGRLDGDAFRWAAGGSSAWSARFCSPQCPVGCAGTSERATGRPWVRFVQLLLHSVNRIPNLRPGSHG